MPKEKMESRLRGILPVKDEQMLKKLVDAKLRKVQARRIPLYDMSGEEQNIVKYPLGLLKEKGVDIPEIDMETVCVTTGPNNLELVNKGGDVVSLTLTGNKIAYSINGSPRKEMGNGEIELI
ncbi:hypothetical protein GF412_00980 [Candidatus Micrarchaeota archaeon]|nr:hypothetical protein [Candidatus Micrarchaeota archaeon]MBD3417546.1 hypothetical protein [Candidatus Micrarchaeota archaeon]